MYLMLLFLLIIAVRISLLLFPLFYFSHHDEHKDVKYLFIVLLFLFHIFYSFGSEQLIIYFMTSQICILDSPKENTHTVHSNKAWNVILFRIQLFN